MSQSRVPISTDEDGFFCFTTPLTLEKEPISVNGSATIGFKLHVHFELNIESGLPPYAFVTLQSKVNSNFGFGIHAENEFLNPKIPLIRIPLNKTPGTIILTPSIDLSIVGELTGDIGFDANVEFSKRTIGAILCNQGIWEAGANDVDSEGFLNINMDSNTSITVEGSVFMGLGMELGLKLFNNDNVKIGIEPKVGLTESAALTFDLPSLSENSYEVFKDSKIDLSLGVHIDAEASANILKDSKALLKTSIFNDNFFEKSYYLFPDFEEPIINVDKESKTAQVNYNVTRDLIFKSGIGVKLYEGDVLTATSPIENYELEEGYKNPLQVTFNNLKPEQNYKVCPYVSFFNLPFEATPAKTFTLEDAPEEEHDDRAALIELYESTGGDNWRDNTNWCSEKPLNEWFGVKTNAAGRVIELDFIPDSYLIGNGLTGKADFTKLTELEKIDCSTNNLTSINVTGLHKLIELICERNELTELLLGYLPALQHLDCAINQLTNLNVTETANLTTLSCYLNKLSTLDVSNLKDLTYLDCSDNNLSILDVSNLYKLHDLFCFNNFIEIIYLHHMPEGYFSYEGWGEQNYDLYHYPDYMNGYQYPHLIYK